MTKIKKIVYLPAGNKGRRRPLDPRLSFRGSTGDSVTALNSGQLKLKLLNLP